MLQRFVQTSPTKSGWGSFVNAMRAKTSFLSFFNSNKPQCIDNRDIPSLYGEIGSHLVIDHNILPSKLANQFKSSLDTYIDNVLILKVLRNLATNKEFYYGKKEFVFNHTKVKLMFIKEHPLNLYIQMLPIGKSYSLIYIWGKFNKDLLKKQGFSGRINSTELDIFYLTPIEILNVIKNNRKSLGLLDISSVRYHMEDYDILIDLLKYLMSVKFD